LKKPFEINEDNQSVMKMIQSEKIDKKPKHMSTKIFFVKDLQDTGDNKLKYCPTESMVADMLTKPLPSTKLKTFREVGIANHPRLRKSVG
jgi:hypothetical protein